jgi:RNA polymerase sigma-70 factor (ECF subfamily)
MSRLRRLSESVLQRVARGDSAAVEECIEVHGGLVARIARRLAPGGADVDDAIQEIFIALWRVAPRFDPARGSEPAFIATLARRRMIDRLRKARMTRTVDVTALELGDPRPAAHAEATAMLPRVLTALGELRPDVREIVELATYGGWTHSEISEHLKLPLGTVKSHVRRGLTQLRDALRGSAK